VAGVVYLISRNLPHWDAPLNMAINIILFTAAICYAVWREKIDIKALIRSILGKFLGKRV
jgi:hypothetical protein